MVVVMVVLIQNLIIKERKKKTVQNIFSENWSETLAKRRHRRTHKMQRKQKLIRHLNTPPIHPSKFSFFTLKSTKRQHTHTEIEHF